MAKKSTDNTPVEQSETVIKGQQSTKMKQAKTRIKAKQPTKVVERVTVIQKEHPQGARWLGASPWVVIAGLIAVALLVFLPIFPAEKTVDKTETIMVPVTKEKQEQVTADETIKVYQGYIEEKGSTTETTSYRSVPYTQYVCCNIYGNYYYETYYVNEAYTTPTAVPGKQTTIDAVAEIVEVQKARGPGDTWILTLTAQDGTQTVYRNIINDDLTKTGKATVSVTKTVSTPYTEQVPKQVTKQEILKLRVNLLSLILQDY